MHAKITGGLRKAATSGYYLATLRVGDKGVGRKNGSMTLVH